MKALVFFVTLLPMAFLAAVLATSPARAAASGAEVEISSGAVTALSCAKEAKATGKLEAISTCPLAESATGIVIYDVAVREIYLVAPRKIHLYELEKAFGGGSVDVTGVVVDLQDGIPVLEVKDYTANARPKPGAFKGCL